MSIDPETFRLFLEFVTESARDARHMKFKGPVVFTTEQAPGAIPNGTPIVKVFSEERDANPVGTTGIVLGSMSDGERIGYFVEWQTMPGVPVFVVEFKIRKQ